jgi:hypothetical protein
MTLTSDPLEFPGSYASSSDADDGMATCTFTVPTTTTYRVWVKTYGPSSTEDSFYIDVNDDGSPRNCGGGSDNCCTTSENTTCTNIFDVAEQIQPCTGDPNITCQLVTFRSEPWFNPLNDRTSDSCGVCTSANFVERRLDLTAGTNTIKFRQRDANARLYYVIVTSDLGYEPVDPGPTPTPCVGPNCVRRRSKAGFSSPKKPN